MRRSVVDGEPGIFPDPIARVYRALVSLLRRTLPTRRKTPRKPH